MRRGDRVKIFRCQSIRCVWVREKQAWYYSPIDFVQIVTGSVNPARYWSDLKRRKENLQARLYADCVKSKLRSKDGLKRRSDMVSAELLEQIGLILGLVGNRNFTGWVASLKTWSKVKESWVSHILVE